MLQHLADGRVDLMMGRGNMGPVYPWFGQDLRNAIPLAVENYDLLRRLWREDVVDWEGRFRTPLTGFTSHAAPARWRAAVRVARLHPQPGDRRSRPRTTATASSTTTSSGRSSTSSAWSSSTGSASSTTATGRRTRPSSAWAGTCSCARTARTRSASSGRTSTTPRSTAARCRSRTTWPMTPMTIGSPQQVIDRTLGFREFVGDYQRQLFLADHAGLPLKTVLEQMDILGSEVVPVSCAASSRRCGRRTCRRGRRSTRGSLAARGEARPRRPSPAADAGRRRRHERARRPARSSS